MTKRGLRTGILFALRGVSGYIEAIVREKVANACSAKKMFVTVYVLPTVRDRRGCLAA